jgi:hypothetical protein
MRYLFFFATVAVFTMIAVSPITIVISVPAAGTKWGAFQYRFRPFVFPDQALALKLRKHIFGGF